MLAPETDQVEVTVSRLFALVSRLWKQHACSKYILLADVQVRNQRMSSSVTIFHHYALRLFPVQSQFSIF